MRRSGLARPKQGKRARFGDGKKAAPMAADKYEKTFFTAVCNRPTPKYDDVTIRHGRLRVTIVNDT